MNRVGINFNAKNDFILSFQVSDESSLHRRLHLDKVPAAKPPGSENIEMIEIQMQDPGCSKHPNLDPKYSSEDAISVERIGTDLEQVSEKSQPVCKRLILNPDSVRLQTDPDPLESEAVLHAATLVELKSILKKRNRER